MKKKWHEILEDCPVIAAVKEEEGFRQALRSECSVVFLLFGDLMNIETLVSEAKKAGKIVLVHMDLIAGLGGKEISVDFMKERTGADGIISTKLPLIRRANELDMLSIMRFFVIDSMAIEQIRKQCELARPDAIEILPGLMPKVIKRIAKMQRIPVIAGGLISDKEDIIAALDAGAISISTTKKELWEM